MTLDSSTGGQKKAILNACMQPPGEYRHCVRRQTSHIFRRELFSMVIPAHLIQIK